MSDEPTLRSRRSMLKCMAYGGAGTLFALAGGVFTPIDLAMAATDRQGAARLGKPLFVQISDTHIGFNKEANPDVNGTLAQSIALVNAMAEQPPLIIHTGDITHLSKPAEFDLAQQLFSQLRTTEMHTVPGEHDTTDPTVTEYFNRFGKASDNKGYYSFDHAGVHFVALVNVLQFKPGGLGTLGADQLAWVADDLKDARPARPSWCSPTCRCGPSMSRGAGEPAMRRSSWSHCAGLARSPCSTATSTRSCRRSKATSPSTPPARPPIRNPWPALARDPAPSRSRQINCPGCSGLRA